MRLSYREYGSGDPPLVILHGLFGSGDNWHSIARQLQSSRRVVTVDLRNHGRSPHSDLFTFPAMAQDVEELFSEVNIQSADVLGHSLGGKVAMELALAWSSFVRRLIVVDIAPKRYQPHNVELKDAMLELDLTMVHSRKDAERALARRVPNRSVQLFLLKNLVREEDGSYRWQLNLTGIAESFAETGMPIAGGRAFDGPALFLIGERSDYVDEQDDGPLIHTLFPKAIIRSVEGASHWVHADRPQEVVRAVDGFLS